jgi:hypothetical protein
LVFKRVVQVSNRDSASVDIAGRAAKRSRVARVIGKGAVGGGSTSSSDDRSGDEHSKEKMKKGKVRTEMEWMATHEDEEAGFDAPFSVEDDVCREDEDISGEEG